METLKSIIQQCHQRHEKPLRQRQTVATPAVYTKDYHHQYTVYCAYRYPVMLQDLVRAHISFMPIGRAPWNDQGPEDYKGKRFFKGQRMTDQETRLWNASWGIRQSTGIPSEHNGARWHNLHFKYEAISAAPDAVAECIEAIVNIVNNPLLTLTKSGGLRISCRVQDYLHPNTEAAKLYIYKDIQKEENIHQRDVYLEIFGEEGYNRWDARYEILVGNLLEPPVVDKEVLFAPIDTLRAKLHQPVPDDTEGKQIITRIPLSLGSENLDLSKEALLQRGFSYVRRDADVHHWAKSEETNITKKVLLSESDGIVWIRASTPNIGLPTQPTPITHVWDDTGISFQIDDAIPPILEKIEQVQKDELSPLAIKRPPPVLEQDDNSEKDEILQRDVFEIENVFDQGVRILGIITGIGPWDQQAEETYFLSGGAITVNTPNKLFAEGAERYFQEQNMPSVVYWKPRTYRWEEVKDIPVHERMNTPFQNGNVCEDAERCTALEKKGGNPTQSICPQCPVYTECQQRGYLSQFDVSQNAKVQLLTISQLFFDPQWTQLVEQILKREDETQRLCVINQQRTHKFFLECKLPRNVIEEWTKTWQGSQLGNFGKTLLSALDIKNKLYGDAVKGIRAVMQTFEWQEEKLIQQMCQVAATANETVRGPMSMAQAIELGILNTETVDSIRQFPTVCEQNDWTYWHQLKRFFTYYGRDADAPIRWDGKVLRFWVPPVLHPRVKRLLLVSSVFSDEHLHRVFGDENLQTHWTEPIPWSHGSRVFQVRTGTYPSETILDYSNWNQVRLTETGERFLRGIQAEINSDLNVKHGIITNQDIATRLETIAKNTQCMLYRRFSDNQKVRNYF